MQLIVMNQMKQYFLKNKQYLIIALGPFLLSLEYAGKTFIPNNFHKLHVMLIN